MRCIHDVVILHSWCHLSIKVIIKSLEEIFVFIKFDARIRFCSKWAHLGSCSAYVINVCEFKEVTLQRFAVSLYYYSQHLETKAAAVSANFHRQPLPGQVRSPWFPSRTSDVHIKPHCITQPIVIPISVVGLTKSPLQLGWFEFVRKLFIPLLHSTRAFKRSILSDDIYRIVREEMSKKNRKMLDNHSKINKMK